MVDTRLSLYEIECALAESRKFDYLRNIVVFNVKGQSEILPIHHECDMLVCSKSGYLTEVEIKRSWSDFLADFKKRHDHTSPLIKYFYYAVPIALKEKVNDFLQGKRKCGIVTYTEDGWVDEYRASPTLSDSKIFLEQRLELARLGCLRVVSLKRKLSKMEMSKDLSELIEKVSEEPVYLLENDTKERIEEISTLVHSKGIIDKDEFKKIINKMADMCPKGWRRGQSVFNMVDAIFGVAREVQFDYGVDCFFNDKVIDEFLNIAHGRYLEHIRRRDFNGFGGEKV